MIGFIRIACGLALILLLGVAAVLRLPTTSEARSGCPAFAALADGRLHYRLPPQWVVVDPFTSRTPYLGQIWFPELPSFSTRVAYLRSRLAAQELFIMFGPASELRPMYERATTRWDHHPLTTLEAPSSTATGDGTTVRWRIAAMNPGKLGGESARYFLGAAEFGDRMLLLNGGGVAAEFDDEAFVDIIRSLTIVK